MTKAKETSESKKAQKKKRKANKTSFTSETAKKAQKASCESRKRNCSLKEWAKFYGKQHITLQMPDKSKVDATWDGAVVVGLYRSAMAGDSKAAKFIADITGQSPAQQVEVKAQVKHEADLTPKEAAEFIAELDKRI